MITEEFRSKATERARVKYIPTHANGDANHKDCETGAISSIGREYVFVKFDKQVQKFGWQGTTSQSCDSRDLIFI